jgi:hypothetical protein
MPCVFVTALVFAAVVILLLAVQFFFELPEKEEEITSVKLKTCAFLLNPTSSAIQIVPRE